MPLRRASYSTLAVLKIVGLLVLSQPIGTAWHEIVGHGLTGVMLGGRIASVEVLGVTLWPALAWRGWTGYYGQCDVRGIDPGSTASALVSLGGAASTLLVAVVAVGLLSFRRWRGWRRTLLIVLALWWLDLFTYLLPVWGLKRSLWWGGRYSEPYEAAVALGVPGPLFMSLAVGVCIGLLAALLMRVRSE